MPLHIYVTKWHIWTNAICLLKEGDIKIASREPVIEVQNSFLTSERQFGEIAVMCLSTCSLEEHTETLKSILVFAMAWEAPQNKQN